MRRNINSILVIKSEILTCAFCVHVCVVGGVGSSSSSNSGRSRQK